MWFVHKYWIGYYWYLKLKINCNVCAKRLKQNVYQYSNNASIKCNNNTQPNRNQSNSAKNYKRIHNASKKTKFVQWAWTVQQKPRGVKRYNINNKYTNCYEQIGKLCRLTNNNDGATNNNGNNDNKNNHNNNICNDNACDSAATCHKDRSVANSNHNPTAATIIGCLSGNNISNSNGNRYRDHAPPTTSLSAARNYCNNTNKSGDPQHHNSIAPCTRRQSRLQPEHGICDRSPPHQCCSCSCCLDTDPNASQRRCQAPDAPGAGRAGQRHALTTGPQRHFHVVGLSRRHRDAKQFHATGRRWRG